MPENIKDAQIVTQTMISGIIAIAFVNSIANMASPVGIWSIINQFQMLMLLILTGAFIPTTVKEYLSGMDFVFLNFDFIPFIDIPLISDLYTWMKFGQKNENLKSIGVDSGSTTVNNISFLAIILILAIMHIPIIIIKC